MTRKAIYNDSIRNAISVYGRGSAEHHEAIRLVANQVGYQVLLPDTISRQEYENYGWCREPDCTAKPHRLVVESHQFPTYP